MICERFGIRGVPTFVYFNTGKMYRYTGPREYADMMKFGAGDYRESKEVADIPPPIGENIITATAYTFQKLVKDLQAIIRFNVYVVMFIFTVGFIVGSMVAMVFAMATLKEPLSEDIASGEEPENREVPVEKPLEDKKSD
jgi:hypothetical protein